MLEWNRPVGVLAPEKVWEPLPWINLNLPCFLHSHLCQARQRHMGPNPSLPPLLPPVAQFLAFHNGSILISLMVLRMERASAVCSTEIRSLDACLIGRGAIPNSDLVGGRQTMRSVGGFLSSLLNPGSVPMENTYSLDCFFVWLSNFQYFF